MHVLMHLAPPGIRLHCERTNILFHRHFPRKPGFPVRNGEPLMEKKRLSAAQGIEAACILFQLNSKAEDILRMAAGIQWPPAHLEGPGAMAFCAEWRAFTHAVITAGLMQHAPNNVLMDYLRQTGNLLRAAEPPAGPGAEGCAAPTDLDSFVDGPFARYMPLLAQEQQARCPELFCQQLASDAARTRGEASPPDDHVKARLAAVMAMVISAVWDKLEQYEILPE